MRPKLRIFWKNFAYGIIPFFACGAGSYYIFRDGLGGGEHAQLAGGIAAALFSLVWAVMLIPALLIHLIVVMVRAKKGGELLVLADDDVLPENNPLEPYKESVETTASRRSELYWLLGAVLWIGTFLIPLIARVISSDEKVINFVAAVFLTNFAMFCSLSLFQKYGEIRIEKRL